MKENDYLKEIIEQNKVIISLLGRMAFPTDELENTIKSQKRNPNKYVRGYNACDGNNTVSKIAAIVGVKQPTMTNVLKGWLKLGIIYEVKKGNRKFYKKLHSI